MKSSSPFKHKTKLLALCVGSVCFYGKYSMELIFSTEMIKLNARNVMFLGKPPFKHKTKILALCLDSVCFYGAEFCY